MPIKLIEPRKGKTPYYTGRGKYLGVRIDRSTGARTAALARKVIKKWESEIENGVFATKGAVTFAGAALSYMKAGGEKRFITPLLEHFQTTPIAAIDQDAIDKAAQALYPHETAATRNRQVYTPVSAIMKRAGNEQKLKRPIGGRGKKRTRFLWPDQAFAILEAAHKLDPEFGIFLDTLLYGGLRLSETLRLSCDDLRLAESFAWTRTTKNSEPQALHLTPYAVTALSNHPRGVGRPGERVFRFHKGGNLDYLLQAACTIASGLPKPPRWKKGPRPKRVAHALDWVSFHYFRHTYGAWMRRYGGLDGLGLVATTRWKNLQSVAVYAHAVTSEEARKANLLPTPKRRERT